MPIDDIDLKFDDELGRKPFVGGYILLGYPNNEEQLARLKEQGIEFDKVLFLMDTVNEDNPAAEIIKRNQANVLFDPEAEMEHFGKQQAFLKEALGEDVCKEVSLNGTPEEVLNRIVVTIDPFFVQVDDPVAVKTTADLAEEEKALPTGEYGNFCPVIFTNQNWLYPGNPELEQQVMQRTYRFSGEEEMELFKKDPMMYL